MSEIKITRADNGWIIEYEGGITVEQGNVSEIHGTDGRGYWRIQALYTPADKHSTAQQ